MHYAIYKGKLLEIDLGDEPTTTLTAYANKESAIGAALKQIAWESEKAQERFTEAKAEFSEAKAEHETWQERKLALEALKG